jgi:hypothetical protein
MRVDTERKELVLRMKNQLPFPPLLRKPRRRASARKTKGDQTQQEEIGERE